jgi:hypothetical protein
MKYQVTEPKGGRTCGHQHRTVQAACACGRKLYGAAYRKSVWSANAAWHSWYIIGPNGNRADLED